MAKKCQYNVNMIVIQIIYITSDKSKYHSVQIMDHGTGKTGIVYR